LANLEAGCLDEDGEVIRNCDKRIYGFSPSTLVPNIYTITALLVAFCLPTIGAVIDFTPYRRRVGQCVAIGSVLIQAAQIGTNQSTWFAMALLQCLGGALYEMHYTISSAYLPDIARYDVDTQTYNSFNQIFYILQFGGEVVFLIAVIALSTILGFNGIQLAQLSQGLGSVWLLVTFAGAWRRFPEMPRRQKLPSEHSNLFVEGFRQNWRTARAIAQQSPVLKWFLWSVAVGEAGTSSLLPIVLSIFSNFLNYSVSEVGLCFLVALLGALPGTTVNVMATRRYGPINSTKLTLLMGAIVTTIAMVHLPMAPESMYPVLGKVYSFFWGMCLGWWYSGESLLFSFLVPAGQESELTGFFVYCTIILAWVPPLIFTLIVQKGGYEAPYGLVSLIACQLVGIVCLYQLPSWDDCLASAKEPLMMLSIDEDDDDHLPALAEADMEQGGTFLKAVPPPTR
jgi:hypothetical protein